MFGRPAKEEPKLDIIIDRVCDEMVAYGPDSEEYAKHLEYLKKLTKLKTATRSERVSINTVIQAVAPIVAIVVIVAYEQKQVWVTKAASFIPKFK